MLSFGAQVLSARMFQCGLHGWTGSGGIIRILFRQRGRRRDRLRLGLDCRRGEASQFGEMLAQDVSCTLSFGNAQAHAGGGESGFGLIDFAVDALFDAVVDSSLHLAGFGFGFLQASQTLLPFCEFGIALCGVLNNLIALIFAV